MTEIKDFKQLVMLCTWLIIEGITKGEPLEKVVHGVLMTAFEVQKEWKKCSPAKHQSLISF